MGAPIPRRTEAPTKFLPTKWETPAVNCQRFLGRRLNQLLKAQLSTEWFSRWRFISPATRSLPTTVPVSSLTLIPINGRSCTSKSQSIFVCSAFIVLFAWPAFSHPLQQAVFHLARPHPSYPSIVSGPHWARPRSIAVFLQELLWF